VSGLLAALQRARFRGGLRRTRALAGRPWGAADSALDAASSGVLSPAAAAAVVGDALSGAAKNQLAQQSVELARRLGFLHYISHSLPASVSRPWGTYRQRGFPW